MKTDDWKEPMDRLTRIADRMLEGMEVDPEAHEGDKCIIFMDSPKMGGIAIHGYEDTSEAISHLLTHLQAIFRANDKKLDIMFMDEEGIDRVDG